MNPPGCSIQRSFFCNGSFNKVTSADNPICDASSINLPFSDVYSNLWVDGT